MLRILVVVAVAIALVGGTWLGFSIVYSSQLPNHPIAEPALAHGGSRQTYSSSSSPSPGSSARPSLSLSLDQTAADGDRRAYEAALLKLTDERIAQVLDAKLAALIKSQQATGLLGQYPPVPTLPLGQRKKILVTGGAGFIGSHLVDALMLQGHLVYVLDNLWTGRRANIQHWIGHPNFEFFQQDVVDPFMIEVDQVYHLACPVAPAYHARNAVKTLKTSVIGTVNMLGLTKRVRGRMVFASAADIYGDALVDPQPETYWGNLNPIGPFAAYAEGKRVAESMCISYAAQHHVNVRIARLFSTFGPRMPINDGRVVSSFLTQALQGKPLSIDGAGRHTRAFLYVQDVVHGLISLMNSNYTATPVNLGSDQHMSVRELADTIVAFTRSSSSIVHTAARPEDPQHQQPDLSTAQSQLGWTPKVSLLDGLELTRQYFQQELLGEPLPNNPPIWIRQPI